MVEELRDQILEKISLIPGVYGFCNINASDDAKPISLKKENWGNSIVIVRGINGLKINLSIILLFSVNVKTIVQEIKSLLEYFLSKNKLKLETLNVLIKGIKL
ncbi:hypothetical protein [Mesomycoplasma molare]|uniref:Uncharacterized protein n=1 Tax=Mesomycoplasma molare TaxID=171288 RepID=A0ABY5TVN1_9BACT|nr:hypothetical protein [Mesomycoplasma molare]UWD34394.1 hypothetical protein NX772_01015 [Mesomycoplasma molare]